METLMTQPALVGDHLVLRTATEEAEIDHLRQTFNEGHYLTAGRPAGHVLWQGIYRTDTESDCPGLVAVLCWGGAAKHLQKRDNHIGRDAVTCANRLKLIAQLRRFYVIDSARRPNLASQCLALSLRTLGGEFEARHGFQPLLAESFHDPEEHTGTLYKATNWLPLGFTKGFKRHRRDFYQDTGKPKHLWIRPLKKDALALLARPGLLPPAHQAAIADGETGGARCALKCPELRTLRHALQTLTDTHDFEGQMVEELSVFIRALEKRQQLSGQRLWGSAPNPGVYRIGANGSGKSVPFPGARFPSWETFAPS